MLEYFGNYIIKKSSLLIDNQTTNDFYLKALPLKDLLLKDLLQKDLLEKLSQTYSKLIEARHYKNCRGFLQFRAKQSWRELGDHVAAVEAIEKPLLLIELKCDGDF